MHHTASTVFYKWCGMLQSRYKTSPYVFSSHFDNSYKVTRQGEVVAVLSAEMQFNSNLIYLFTGYY